MLPADFRLRSSVEFRDTVRRGVRVARPTMVLHMAYAHPDGAGNTEAMSHVGFIVSRKVGNAVTRNRVKRRLRALVRDELARTPGGLRIVVRALPASATEPARLAEDLASAWAGGLSKLGVRAGARQESGGGEAMKA